MPPRVGSRRSRPSRARTFSMLWISCAESALQSDDGPRAHSQQLDQCMSRQGDASRRVLVRMG